MTLQETLEKQFEQQSKLIQDLAFTGVFILRISPSNRDALEKALRLALSRYQERKSAEGSYNPTSIRESLNRLNRSFDFAIERIAETPRPILSEVEQKSVRSTSVKAVQFDDLRDQLAQFQEAIVGFESDFKPARGRKTQWALEDAVRELEPFLKNLCDQEVTISLNKNNGRRPEPRSGLACFLVSVLRAFDASLTQTAIVNMIHKVGQNPTRGKDTIDALFEDKSDPIDLHGQLKPQGY